MADLVTRIVLDNKQFDDNIKKSKQEIKSFENLQSTLASGVGKFAAALSVATTAQEVFNGMMQNSQAFGDAMTMAINASKDSVNEFFYSLATGDFSSFINGIDQIINKSKEASASLDQLGNTKMAYSYVKSEHRREISEARTVANNQELSKEEREKGFEAWNKGLEQLKETSTTYRNDAIQAAKDLAEKGTQVDDVSLKNLDYILKLDVQNQQKRKDEKERLANEYSKYENALAQLDKKRKIQITRETTEYGRKTVNEQFDVKKKSLAKEYELAIMYNNLLAKKSDEELNNIYQIVNEANNAKEELGSKQEEYNNAYRQFKEGGNKKPTTPTVKPKVEIEYEEGSLGYINQQIKDKKVQFEMAIDDISRIKLQEELDELEKKKRYIKLQIEYSKPNEDIKRKNSNDLKGIHNNFKEMGTYKAPKTLDIPKLDKSSIKWADSLNEAFAGAGQSISSLGDAFGAFSQNAALGKSALILGAIGQLVYGFAQASAKTFSPWEWIAFAVSGAATLASVISQISAYETGGIVGGNNFTGDRNLIRVNSGEMILNKRQQNNLFNAINNGTIGKNNYGGGQVQFIIKGKDLVGTLANYNNKVSKVL